MMKGRSCRTSSEGRQFPSPVPSRSLNSLKAQSQMRGTHSSNPNQGKLAAQASKPAKVVPESRQEERLVVSRAVSCPQT